MRTLGLCTFALLVACAPAPQKKAALGEEDTLPPQVTMTGVRIRSWEGNQLVATGKASRLTYNRSNAGFEATDVFMHFPSESRKGTLKDLKLQAPTVTGNLATRQADGFGGVLLRSSSGLVGKTERMHFDGVGLVASSDTPVDARGPDFKLQAKGFKYFFLTEDLVFEGDVDSRLGGAGDSR